VRRRAGFLIGTGARISEALDVRFRHLDANEGVVRIYRQQGRNGDMSRSTKGKRFRSVQVGPRLADVLIALRDDRGAVPDDWLFVCPPPRPDLAASYSHDRETPRRSMTSAGLSRWVFDRSIVSCASSRRGTGRGRELHARRRSRRWARARALSSCARSFAWRPSGASGPRADNGSVMPQRLR
jgi:integrase